MLLLQLVHARNHPVQQPYYMKSIFLLLAVSILLATACNDKSNTSEHGHDHADAAANGNAEHAGAHTYSCPMHPEVVSDKPGQCPKCGMNLEHTDNATASTTKYAINLSTKPEAIAAGKPVVFSFTPQIEGQAGTPVPLDLVHEKKMHVIIVSKDLSQFYHEHPDYTAQGSYDLSYTFRNGGNYVVYEDYTPSGATHQLGRQEIVVSGPAKPTVTFTAGKQQWSGNGYTAELKFDKPLKVKQSLLATVTVQRNGKPVTDLDNYLGALGHMVIISQNTEQYLHVHPNDSPDKGPTVSFHTGFETAGLYRVFLQFNHAGQIQTADFTINVAA